MLLGFFRRRRSWFLDAEEEPSEGFSPTPFPTLNPFLWRPVAAGVWRHHEIFDGTYDIGDLLDIHEMLEIKEKNERRYREYVRPKS